MASKKILYEVSIIRPLVILLLVVMHSFSMYGGGWELPKGMEIVVTYKWFVKFIVGFRIETIALVAGYVFAYQSIDLGRKYDIFPFIIKKFKRLIIPAIFFGFIYFFLFLYKKEIFSSREFILSLVSGIGHLWFLPMLFWCFLFLCFIGKHDFQNKWLFIILAFLSIIPIPFEIPLGLQRVFHFLFYCYGGYLLYANRILIYNKFLNKRTIILLCVLYILLVVINTEFIISLNIDNASFL